MKISIIIGATGVSIALHNAMAHWLPIFKV
jgi:hypothetical protein